MATKKLFTYEIYQDKAKEWRWRFKKKTGEIFAYASEGYKTKWGVQRALKNIKAGKFRFVSTPKGERLVAGNNRTLAIVKRPVRVPSLKSADIVEVKK